LGSDDITVGVPQGWAYGTTAPSDYRIGIDRTLHHGGKGAAFLQALNDAEYSTFVSLAQQVSATSYRGKRVRWSAWVKSLDVSGTESGLWMRVDGPTSSIAFDNMASRAVRGTQDWQQVSVVLDVAQDALGVSLGALLNKSGVLLIDDAKFEVVGPDVPSTNTLTSPIPAGVDSATIAAEYARQPNVPINLDFEGVPPIASSAAAWIASNTVTLNTTDPAAPLDDLQPLVNMVGSAHLIGLGEDTHGTREFFRMKHRILELMVKQLGTTYFAMEATSPESDDMNQYVLNGVGDPKKLLSGLYFWTWDTQEVLDMIQWMRSWNSTAPSNQRVQFLGFDMQFPGAAMDSVAAFIARVDPSRSAMVSSNYACLVPYRNHGASFVNSLTQYAAQSASTKASCAAGLQQVYNAIDSSRTVYTAASSSTVYEAVKHDARLVQQFEAMASVSNVSNGVRDQAMAENIEWIRDHAPPGARIVLWAHNGHISRLATAMGSYLGANYGSDYVNLGFAFGHGHFNAVGVNVPLQAWDAELIPSNSIEAAFTTAGKQLALLDTRLIPGAGTAAAPLAGPIPMRSIGALFDPTAESAYFYNALFPNDFDLLVFVNATTASTLLF
jgi:erythromycin esterase